MFRVGEEESWRERKGAFILRLHIMIWILLRLAHHRPRNILFDHHYFTHQQMQTVCGGCIMSSRDIAFACNDMGPTASCTSSAPHHYV